MDAPLLNRHQAAEFLGGISVRTLDRLIAEKRLTVVHIKRRRLLHRAELERFAKRCIRAALQRNQDGGE